MISSISLIILQAFIIGSFIVLVPYTIGWCATGRGLLHRHSRLTFEKSFAGKSTGDIRKGLLGLLSDPRYSLAKTESEAFLLKKHPNLLHYGMFLSIHQKENPDGCTLTVDVFPTVPFTVLPRLIAQPEIEAALNRLCLIIG